MDIRGVAASCGLKVGEKGEVGSGLSIISIGLRRTLFFFPVFFFFPANLDQLVACLTRRGLRKS